MATTLRDLKHINTIEELQREIVLVRARLIIRENDLKQRLKDAPAQAGKMALKAAVPAVIAKKALGSTAGLLSGVTRLFTTSKNGRNKALSDIWRNAKTFGLSSILGGAVNVLRKR